MGATIHYLSLKRGMKFRLRFTVLFAVLTIGAGISLAKVFEYDFSKFQACPVCGFVTLPEPGTTCPVCNVKFEATEAAIGGYSSMDEYLVAEQLMFFQPAEKGAPVDFYGACDCPEKYPKSPSWKPAITATEVLEVQALSEK
jgi:hypothetical protein